MRRRVVFGGIRGTASAGLSILIGVGDSHAGHVNPTTVALTLGLLILGVFTKWPWNEGVSHGGEIWFTNAVCCPGSIFHISLPDFTVASRCAS